MDDLERAVRRLRKKLRQIEHLESLHRDLNDEEALKVRNKNELRTELAQLLAEMKRKSDEAFRNDADEIVADVENHLNDAEERKKPKLSQEVNNEVTSSSSSSPRLSRPNSQSSSSTSSRSPRKKPKKTAEKSVWRNPNKRLLVQNLDENGHEDSVLCADVRNDLIITGGKDTAVLIWKVTTRENLGGLRGHAGPVTSVKIIADERALSASIDCHIKLWDLNEFRCLKSVYTFNAIRDMTFCGERNLAIIGNEGYKIETYSLNVNNINDDEDVGFNQVQSVKDAHSGFVTKVDVKNNLLASGSNDGVVKVWKFNADDHRIRCIFALESEFQISKRCVFSLKILNESVLTFGDAGKNLKIVNFRNSSFAKLSNHIQDSGFTDSLSLVRVTERNSLLLASSFDSDDGSGHVNVFLANNNDDEEQQQPSYLCSWTDEDTNRIFSIGSDVGRNNEGVVMVTCGPAGEVKLWRTIEEAERDLPEDEDAVIISPVVLPLYSAECADSCSSDIDDDEDDVEGDEESSSQVSEVVDTRESSMQEGSENVSSASWRCTIL